MSTQTTVYTDIESLLAASVLASGFDLPVIFPNDNTVPKPEDGTGWLEVNYLYNDARPATMGMYGEDAFSGILQIDYNEALNRGTVGSRLFRDKVAGYYIAGLPLVMGVFKGWVTRCTITGGRQMNGFWRVTASIYWEGRASRQPAL